MKRCLSASKSAGVMAPSATCASTPWTSRRVRASWRRHHTRSANTITCSSPATAASVCAITPRSSGSPSPPPRIASATSPWRTSACASAAREWVSVSGSTLASTNTPTLPRTTPWARASSAIACVNRRVPASSVLSSRSTLEQPPVGLAAAVADRVEQLGQRGVAVERDRLGGPDLRHPLLHVLAGDAHEVRPVVDAQAVRVDLVHQVAGLARVQPLVDHRFVAEREPDEHVERLGALAARGGGQQPAVGDAVHAHVPQRLVGLGGGVGVAQRLVGDQQVPGDDLELGGVAVEQAVGDQRHARPVAELAVERADLRGHRPAVVEHEHGQVGGQRRQPASRGAALQLVAPLRQQPALGHHHRS